MFAQAKRTVALQGCRFVRAPVDFIEQENTVVYEYMTNTLLHLVGNFFSLFTATQADSLQFSARSRRDAQSWLGAFG